MTAPPPDFSTADHYAALGVQRNASEAEITRAYKALALQHHPDKNPANRSESEVCFKRIAEAYAVLRDPAHRREYDSNATNRSYVSYEEAEQMWRQFGGAADAPAEEGFGNLRDVDTKRKAYGLLTVFAALLFAPRLFLSALPVVIFVLMGVSLLSRRDMASKSLWLMMALVLAYLSAPWVLRTRSKVLSSVGVGGAEPPRGGDDAAFIPHSGELLLLEDGDFVRRADPSVAPGAAATEGWQQRLVSSMTRSIKSGQEQVVMVFSRQGCPWCVRQEPVLEEAIRRRAGVESADEEAPEEEADAAAGGMPLGRAALMGDGPVPARSGGLLFAPLRVFIFDAGEFPGLAQSFNIEAFPTTIAWGPPGVVPMAAKGYLDDANFDTLLRTVATAEPQGAGGGKKKRRGLFR
mmetsp:Transcript_120409/g.257061  ORF Transcript_120409/g.257061 Transcript_120409/m.257061 type:complete len:407 (-) Transcript_120409:80-1300(-)